MEVRVSWLESLFDRPGKPWLRLPHGSQKNCGKWEPFPLKEMKPFPRFPWFPFSGSPIGFAPAKGVRRWRGVNPGERTLPQPPWLADHPGEVGHAARSIHRSSHTKFVAVYSRRAVLAHEGTADWALAQSFTRHASAMQRDRTFSARYVDANWHPSKTTSRKLSKGMAARGHREGDLCRGKCA